MLTLFELFGVVFLFTGVGTAFPHPFFSTTSLLLSKSKRDHVGSTSFYFRGDMHILK